MRTSRLAPVLVLLVGVLGVSTGAIFVRMADAHPIVKSAYRLGMASLILVPIAVCFHWREYRTLSRRDVGIGLLSAAFLVLHFALWMTSLDYTTVASSVMLVSTVPIWVALINMLLGRGRPSRAMSLCIVLSVIGASIVGYGDVSFDRDALTGDALALAGAVAASVYILCGRELRMKLSVVPYVALCYGSAAVMMWCVALAMGLKLSGFSGRTWGAFLGMALMAQVIGHSCYNWALGYFSAGTVSVVLLGEPLGSAVIAYFMFGEVPTPMKLAGCALLMLSIVLTARSGE